jgi:predicted transcriptional regulator
MNNYPVRYAFRLDPTTEAALDQIARHTFQSKASIMRRYVQAGVEKEAIAYNSDTQINNWEPHK